MFCSHDVCVTWAHLRLANLELVVHVGVKSAVSSSQPEQNNLLCPVQFVEAVHNHECPAFSFSTTLVLMLLLLLLLVLLLQPLLQLQLLPLLLPPLLLLLLLLVLLLPLEFFPINRTRVIAHKWLNTEKGSSKIAITRCCFYSL